MTTSPSGPFAHAKDQLKTLLAACAAFQAWVDADDATEAATHIYFDELPPPAQGSRYTKAELVAYRPLAIISYPDEGGHRRRRIAEGYGCPSMSGGTCVIHFEMNAPEDEETEQPTRDTAEAIRLMENAIGDVEDDMWELTNTNQPSPSTDTYLDLAATDVLMSARRIDPKFVNDDGDHLGLVLRVDWGRSL